MAPLTLVQAAGHEQRASKRRRKADGPDFDEIWCVFDTDEHPNLPQALAQAASSGILTAVSNPCFELWLVLHVQDQNAHIDRHGIQRQARALSLTDGKSIRRDNEGLLLANVSSAVGRAKGLDEKHALDDSPLGSNPSSGMWRLVVAIQG